MNNDIELIQQDLTQVADTTAYLDEINEALNRVYQVAPSVENELALIQANAAAMLQTMKHVTAAAQALMRVALDFQQQRDQIAASHENMKTDLQTLNLSNPFVEHIYAIIYESSYEQACDDVYENVMEEHNEAFWESLPYDMAHMMSKDSSRWGHMDADTLYTLITIDPKAVPDDRDEYGFTYLEMIQFRQNLLAMVKKIQQTPERDQP